MENAYQHAKENYRLEGWLRNSTFLVHYMRDGAGKLTTWSWQNWRSLSRLCQRLKGLCSICFRPYSADGAQAGSPSPQPKTALCLTWFIAELPRFAVSEADQKMGHTAQLSCEAAQQGGMACCAGGGAGTRPEGNSAGHPTGQQGSTAERTQPARTSPQTAGAAHGAERPLQLGESLADSEAHEAPLQNGPGQRMDLQPRNGTSVAVPEKAGGSDALGMAGSPSHEEELSGVGRGDEQSEEEREALPAGVEQGLPSQEAAGRTRVAVGRRRGKHRTQQRGNQRPNHRHLLRQWHT